MVWKATLKGNVCRFTVCWLKLSSYCTYYCVFTITIVANSNIIFILFSFCVPILLPFFLPHTPHPVRAILLSHRMQLNSLNKRRVKNVTFCPEMLPIWLEFHVKWSLSLFECAIWAFTKTMAACLSRQSTCITNKWIIATLVHSWH